MKNRTAAEKAAMDLIAECYVDTVSSEVSTISQVADIIERACGQGADSEKVGNNFLTPKLKALDLYYAQKDGCPNGHPSGAGKICVDCVAQALAERSCEHDGIESVLLMFYRHIDRFGVDPKDRTEQSQSQVRCFDAYWKLKTEERSCGETAWVSVEEFYKTFPHCIGYPGCDGDLVGMSHEPECPLFGKQAPTMFQFAEAYAKTVLDAANKTGGNKQAVATTDTNSSAHLPSPPAEEK